MDNNNLIFSSNIDSEVEDICFDMLLQYFSDKEYDNVYVTNVILAPMEVIFFVKIEGKESIIRVQI